jgi:hypothetical protein
VLKLGTRQLYTASMMQRRTLRITAWILLFILSTIVVEGYDVLSGGNITKTFSESIGSCLRL